MAECEHCHYEAPHHGFIRVVAVFVVIISLCVLVQELDEHDRRLGKLENRIEPTQARRVKTTPKKEESDE